MLPFSFSLNLFRNLGTTPILKNKKKNSRSEKAILGATLGILGHSRNGTHERGGLGGDLWYHCVALEPVFSGRKTGLAEWLASRHRIATVFASWERIAEDFWQRERASPEFLHRIVSPCTYRRSYCLESLLCTLHFYEETPIFPLSWHSWEIMRRNVILTWDSGNSVFLGDLSGSRKRGVGKEGGNLHDGFGGFDGWQ